MNQETHSSICKGIKPPNYTQVPNCLLDAMGEFTGVEFKVLMVICRQTFGWHRDSANMSITFLANQLGASRQSVISACSALEEKGVIQTSDGGGYHDGTIYKLVIEDWSKNLTNGERDWSKNLTNVSLKIRPMEGPSNIDIKKDINKGDISLFPNEETKPKRQTKTFVKPTLEEVQDFSISIGLRSGDGEAFFHGKEANGWKNGPSPMKDWKAAIRAWKAQGYFPSQKEQAHQARNTPRERFVL